MKDVVATILGVLSAMVVVGEIRSGAISNEPNFLVMGIAGCLAAICFIYLLFFLKGNDGKDNGKDT